MTIKQLSDAFKTAVANTATLNTYSIDNKSGMNVNSVVYPVLFVPPELLKGYKQRKPVKYKNYDLVFYVYEADNQTAPADRLEKWKDLEVYGISFWAYVEANNNIDRLGDIITTYAHDVYGNNSVIGVKFSIKIRTLDC